MALYSKGLDLLNLHIHFGREMQKKLPIQFDVAQQSRERVYTKITKISISQSNRCLKHHKNNIKNAPFSGAAIFAITYHKTLIINTDVCLNLLFCKLVENGLVRHNAEQK